MGSLSGKVAFITGAARGQGRSHAVRLAEEGANIIAIDICAQIDTVRYPMGTAEDLQQTVELVEKAGGRIVAARADVRDRSSLREAVEQGVSEFGRLDAVVANAGIAVVGPAEDEEATWDDVIAVNLTGVWNTVRVAVPRMIEGHRGGSIVLTSSSAGLKAIGSAPGGEMNAYTASKHGVVGLMRGFAKSLAPHSIRVNSVHPCGVNTPMVNNEAMAALLGSMASNDAMTNLLPVELIEPCDVANAVAWLLSEQARYITGVTLSVDAGFNLR